MSETGVPAENGNEPTLRSVAVGGLRQEISEILREAIWGGVLKPGQRLNEQWLASKIGVSRPPLREAIRPLEQEGLVVSIPRKGTFVRTLTGQDIVEIYTVRCALEGMAAELLTERIPTDELTALERQIDRVESRPLADLRHIIDEDLEFHRALVRASGNQRLVGLWEQIASQLRLALTLVDPAFFRSEYVESTHRPLIRAISAGDHEEVRRLTRSLLDVGRSLEERWDETVFAGDAGQRGESSAIRSARGGSL